MATLSQERIATLIARLNEKHPNARYELDWTTPLQLLVGTILAAQCTDERVNKVTPALFEKYPDARAFAEADRAVLEDLLKPTGYFRQKAKTVQEVCQVLLAKHNGEVPRSMEELIELPGVARKSANVVLNNAFKIPSGIIVDTHVNRVAPRLGLTKETKPEKIEKDLMKLIPKEEWCTFGPALVLHGRYTCTHSAPRCGECIFRDFCPRIGVATSTELPLTGTVQEKKPEFAAEVFAEPATLAETPAAPPSLWDSLPDDWAGVVKEAGQSYFASLRKYVAQERAQHTVFPPAEEVFNAFKYTPFDKVKVLLLGQDPYHDDGQAHGLSFSVRPGVKPPPSLVNMFKELKADLGIDAPDHGCLIPWVRQGVMLLNTSLTVRAHEAASHAGQGWELFTDAVIRALSARDKPLVFLLWGGHAQKKASLIDTGKHRVLKMAHPSPLSAKKFLGSKPYSGTNALLAELGQEPVDWTLPKLGKKPSPTAFDTPAPTPTPALPPVAEKKPEPIPSRAGLALDLALKTAVLNTVGPLLSADWRAELNDALQAPSFLALNAFLDQDAVKQPAMPASEAIYRPLRQTPFRSVRVVLLGEEPDGDADGLAWSQTEGSPLTPAQENLFAELCADLGCWRSTTTSLETWADRGVLLWNSVPTRRVSKPATHANKGWEEFTKALLTALAQRAEPVVFAFLGPKLNLLRRGLDLDQHAVVLAPHPTQPVFRGCGVFSRINEALELRGRSGVWWQLPAM